MKSRFSIYVLKCQRDKSRLAPPGPSSSLALRRPGRPPPRPIQSSTCRSHAKAWLVCTLPNPSPGPPSLSYEFECGTSQGRTLELLRNPAGGGGLRLDSLKPSERVSDLPQCPLSGKCWMVRVVRLGKAFPLPAIAGLKLCPRVLDGAERSLMGPPSRALAGSQVQGCTSPPPPSCFRVGGPLAWVPVLAA